MLQEREVFPCHYRNQRKRWVDAVLSEEWVRDMDKKFVSEAGKVALVISNCPAHPQIEKLKSIKFFSSWQTQLLRHKQLTSV